MYWLFKFSGLLGALVRLGAIPDRENVVGKDTSVDTAAGEMRVEASESLFL
jgi:hypothetical protein